MEPGLKSGWTVRNWCAESDLGHTKVYELIDSGAITSVKVGARRIITTSPAAYFARLAEQAD